MLLTACAADNRLADLKAGAPKVLPAPPCAVQATTRVGQRWVNGVTEGGVRALGWARPKFACRPDAAAKAAPASRPKKKHFWQRGWLRQVASGNA
jgi:hypothetical protein